MKLEDQVTHLELSKRLKELGVKQESLFFWNIDQDNDIIVDMRLLGNWNDSYISAFTVAELGEKLDKEIPVKVFDAEASRYVWFYYEGTQAVYTPTEANARAKMLIY